MNKYLGFGIYVSLIENTLHFQDIGYEGGYWTEELHIDEQKRKERLEVLFGDTHPRAGAEDVSRISKVFL